MTASSASTVTEDGKKPKIPPDKPQIRLFVGRSPHSVSSLSGASVVYLAKMAWGSEKTLAP